MKSRAAIYFAQLLIPLFALFIFTSGCKGGATSSSFSLPSLGQTPASTEGPLPGTSDGVTDPSQLYVGVRSDVGTVAHVRGSTSFDSKCSISKTDASKDINCLIDIPEGDLYVNGLIMKYNVPPDMCRYLRRKTYWYYNKEVGVGPSAVGMRLNYNASGDLTAFDCSVDSGGFGACAGFREVSINQTTRAATCTYDGSATGGPNCCFGNYTLTITTLKTGTATTVQSTNSNWGGQVKNCIGGPGKTDWQTYTKAGFPMEIIDKTKLGESGEYKITAPLLTTSEQSTIPVANYFHVTDHTHTGFVDTRSTNKPYYVDPVDDRSGTPIPADFDPTSYLYAGNAAYTFECLTEAYEVKHRINVYVREWDTFQDFSNYVSVAGHPEVFDRTGNETPGSPTCDGVTGPCDDQFDADDFVRIILGGFYNMTAPAIPLRGTYFPNLN